MKVAVSDLKLAESLLSLTPESVPSFADIVLIETQDDAAFFANQQPQIFLSICLASVYARGLANLLDLYIPIVDTTCVYDGASFPPIPIAAIDGENELVLDYDRCERIQLHRKDASND